MHKSKVVKKLDKNKIFINVYKRRKNRKENPKHLCKCKVNAKEKCECSAKQRRERRGFGN